MNPTVASHMVILQGNDAERVAKVLQLKHDGDMLHQNVFIHASLSKNALKQTVLYITFEGDD